MLRFFAQIGFVLFRLTYKGTMDHINNLNFLTPEVRVSYAASALQGLSSWANNAWQELHEQILKLIEVASEIETDFYSATMDSFVLHNGLALFKRVANFSIHEFECIYGRLHKHTKALQNFRGNPRHAWNRKMFFSLN